MEKKKRLDLEVAILGGGFAGIYCGKSLLKTLGRNSQNQIGLISEQNYMVFQPMLPEVVSGSLSPRHVVNPIRHLCKGMQVYKAEVESIDFSNKMLTLRPGPYSPEVLVRFRHLVLALGASVDLSRVPGMAEHAYLMQNVGDAMKLRATVLSRFEEANLVTDPERRRRLLTFVVVGGGYSGVETAGQILDLFTDIHPYYRNIDTNDFDVFLVHSRDHLLPTLSLSLGKYAQRKLRERGLKLCMERRVKAVTANQVQLDDGTFIESNTAISTVGNAPHPLISRLAQEAGLETLHGRIKTQPSMQVKGYDWLWAAGDCAAVPMEDGETCPSTAQFAMRQGALLGNNINGFLRAEEVRPFKFKGLGELAAIGHHTAVAEVMGMKFSGFLAWWMWRTIYLAKLPGLDRKLRVMIDWSLDLFFPRDINLLSPRYTKPLQAAHLQAGDILFRSGEPAFSFYIVKKGRIELTDSNGKHIKTVTSGDFFGERALLGDKRWRFTATAAENSQLIGLGSAEFKAILENSRSMRQLLEDSARQYSSASDIEAMKATLPEALLRQPADSLMTTQVNTFRLSDKIMDALKQLNRNRHSFYPVRDEDGTLRGVISREQFYNHVQIKGLTEAAKVADLPLKTIPRVGLKTSIGHCLETVIRGGSNKLLVTDDQEHLQGILTIRDVLAAAVDAKQDSGSAQPKRRPAERNEMEPRTDKPVTDN